MNKKLVFHSHELISRSNARTFDGVVSVRSVQSVCSQANITTTIHWPRLLWMVTADSAGRKVLLNHWTIGFAVNLSFSITTVVGGVRRSPETWSDDRFGAVSQTMNWTIGRIFVIKGAHCQINAFKNVGYRLAVVSRGENRQIGGATLFNLLI